MLFYQKTTPILSIRFIHNEIHLLSPKGLVVVPRHEIKKLVKDAKWQGVHVILGMSFVDVFYQKILFPEFLTLKDCRLEIQDNIQQYFPSVTDELSFDLIVNTNAKNEKICWVVAAKKSVIKTYAEDIKRARLKLNVIDVDVFALVRAVYYFLPLDSSYRIIIFAEATCQYILLLQKQELLCAISNPDNLSLTLLQLQNQYQLSADTVLLLCGKSECIASIQNQIHTNLSMRIVDLEHPLNPNEQSTDTSWLIHYGLLLRGKHVRN